MAGRFRLMTTGAITALLLATSANAQDLKPFTFKGVTAGIPVDLSTVGRCGSADKDGVVKCTPHNKSMGGRTKFDGPKMGFIDGRLVYMTYTYDIDEIPVLMEMLEMKYGLPINEHMSGWEGTPKGAGGVSRWHFKTGVLTATTDKTGKGGRLLYVDDYKPSDKALVPDF